MNKIYVCGDRLFKESSIDLYVEYLLGLGIKYLTTKQDCLDWIVYSPYFVVSGTDQIIISYGLVKTYDNELIYHIDQNEYTASLKTNTKSFEWYDSVLAI